MKSRLIAFSSLLITSILLFSGCATEPSLYTGKTGYYAYTWDQELALGKKSDTEIVQQMGLYPDDGLSEYVKGIGHDLLEKSAFHQEDTPEIYQDTDFVFRVLDSPVVNAFALPGGFVYVTRGLLAHLNNEAQLAVVIGHEITHVEARHASQQALKQQWGQIGLLAGAIIGEQVAENKELARQMVDLSGSLFQLMTLKYGRDAERESDFHGVEYATKAGYDASEGSAFFRSLKRISEKSGQTIPSWMSSHPDPGERETTIAELSRKWETGGGGEPIVGQRQFFNHIEGLIVGQNPREGFVSEGRFLHPELSFQFDIPTGWKVQNERSAVYLAEPNGTALLALTPASQDSPFASVQALAERLKVSPSYAGEELVNGLPAYALEGTVTTQNGQIPIYAQAIEYQGSVYQFLGYGSPASYPVHRQSIAQTARSFQELRDAAAKSIQPYRLTIEPASRSATFRELLPDRLPPDMDAQDWAIMNQVELDDRIEKGTLLKLPTQ
ncbi:M48 family metalloprotease [Pelagicoccus sp. SDUM812003]|uniref:M48 family metalloprotease n=1 Tax=Pelagicoccus sp. SDUM812003 TaxID=3041267 RepID=UPI00280FF2D7|nr:M48 family metalloprotease [Pelagicoccus sp. SDUM812003]MDQ8203637.1 M48 family metalloprotease [Pelagicoccus sp. SDUM812003]